MSAFFDTNVLISEQKDARQAGIARELLAAGGAISVQLLNEFASVSHRKLQKSFPEIGAALDDVLALMASPPPIIFGHTFLLAR